MVRILYLNCVFTDVFNSAVVDIQILISHAEPKDGSGGPPDDEDRESGDVTFPGEAEELERAAFLEHTTDPDHRSSILVRHL